MKAATKMSVHYSSKIVEWETPQTFFDKYNEIYEFTLDVCATRENAKCKKFFTKEENALALAWSGVCWMNPPYGRSIKDWVEKAYISAKAGATVVCLLPARTDTRWFHDYCSKGKVEFIKGRLKFGSMENNAPFPSMIVVFKGI